MSIEAQTLLDAVDAAILALVTKKVASYGVGGVNYVYADLEKLRALRKDLQAECRSGDSMVRLGDIS